VRLLNGDETSRVSARRRHRTVKGSSPLSGGPFFLAFWPKKKNRRPRTSTPVCAGRPTAAHSAAAAIAAQGQAIAAQGQCGAHHRHPFTAPGEGTHRRPGPGGCPGPEGNTPGNTVILEGLADPPKRRPFPYFLPYTPVLKKTKEKKNAYYGAAQLSSGRID